MRKTLIFLLIVLTFFVLFFPFSFDFATSVVPGWHTTIFPPFFIFGVLFSIILLIDFIIYWIAYKKELLKLKKIVLIHFLISLIICFLTRYSELWIPKLINESESSFVLSSIQSFIIIVKAIILIQFIYFSYVIIALVKK